jgi:chromosome segregation protein
MKLKKLEITGFKSFPQKASISFPPGISAVVGPNGCGKSNIVDALRWVMGEQSVKQLRGKSMEDVIFSGADGHPPLNLAEVSVTLINDNGSAPEELRDFSEIMLTRRLYRSGESAYLLNKQPCRLKDIHNVFMGSGMGAKSYSVIQQGNVGAITDAGPDERRVFIEEAAGITRYKQRKIEALRKVDQTNQNLLRVNDIVGEIQRQMASLKRQAKKAERYKTFQERVRILDIRLCLHYYDEYNQKIKQGNLLLRELKDADLAHSSKLRKLDAAVEEIRLRKAQKDQQISDQKDRRFDLQRRIDRTESDLSHLHTDIERLQEEIEGLEAAEGELKEKDAGIRSEIEQAGRKAGDLSLRIDAARRQLDAERSQSQEMRNRLADLNRRQEAQKADLMDLVAQEARYKNIYQTAHSNRETLQRQIKRADEEALLAQKQVSDLENQLQSAETTLQTCSERLDALNADIEGAKIRLDQEAGALAACIRQAQQLELERSKIRSKHAALKKMEENFEWYRDGVRAVMTAQEGGGDTAPAGEEAIPKAPEVLALMADVIEPAPSFETAAEAVLGDCLQHILVRDQQAAVAGIDYLQALKAGRGGFVPLNGLKSTGGRKEARRAAERRLLDHVTVKPGFEGVAETLLGHVVVAEDLPQALDQFNANGVEQTLVTKEGEVVSRDGVIVGGSRDKLSGILAKKQEIKDLAKQMKGLDGDIEAARTKQGRLEASVRQMESELQQRIEQKNAAAREQVDAEKALYRTAEALKHSRRHLDVALLEQERLLGEESDADEELSKYHQALLDIADQVADAQATVTATAADIAALTEEVAVFDQRVVDIKLNLTRLNAQLDNTSQTLRRLRDFQQDGVRRLEQIRRDLVLKHERLSFAQEKIETEKKTLTAIYTELEAVDHQLEESESEYQVIDSRIRDNDRAISEIQGQRQKTLEKFRLLELEQSQLTITRDNLVSRLEERYQAAFSQLRNRIPTEAPEVPVEEMEAQITKLREKVARITDVNLGAIKEYGELKERFEFLTAQREDLLKAIDDLMKVIKKINRITQKRFMDTFERVNAKLAEVFPRLFEGGTAKLILTEPDKPLETGVEFMVHPPGKKLTRMTLLSGGEKALSAIALIFSLFLLKPTAFCIMDEIDAPLDDVNVSRFNHVLKLIGEKSQIIMITHNKHTMEFADTLFGITMQKKGISKVVSVDFIQAQHHAA